MRTRQCLRNAVLVAVLIAMPFTVHVRMAVAQSPEQLIDLGTRVHGGFGTYIASASASATTL